VPTSFGVPNVARSMPAVRGFQSGESPVFEYPYALSGVTRDSTGAVLAGCNVKLFRTADDSLVSQTTSDANGIYIIPASPALQHYLVTYKTGSPDVTGASVNTLTGA
jgi:hypothetical protein